MTPHRDFEAVAAAVQASAMLRAADRISSAALTAWDRSRIARSIRGASVQFGRLGHAERVRAIAVMAVTAFVGHLVLLSVVPPQVAPAAPRLFWIAAAVAVAVVAVFPRATVVSWQTSIVRRLVTGAAARRN